jgi:hypothetical protein
MPLVSVSNDQRKPLPLENYVATIHDGIPPDLYRPSFEQGSYLAFLGRISPKKRPDRAIRIARAAGISVATFPTHDHIGRHLRLLLRSSRGTNSSMSMVSVLSSATDSSLFVADLDIFAPGAFRPFAGAGGRLAFPICSKTVDITVKYFARHDSCRNWKCQPSASSGRDRSPKSFTPPCW